MTIEEKKERIKVLESILFHIDMKDHWDALDLKRYNEYSFEVEELKREIEESE